ncbi:ribose-phosphate pyrophosphokinase [Nannochloropsis oceanica]
MYRYLLRQPALALGVVGASTLGSSGDQQHRPCSAASPSPPLRTPLLPFRGPPAAAEEKRDTKTEEEKRVEQDERRKLLWERTRPPHQCTHEGKFVRGCQELKIFSGRSHPGLAKEVGDILGVAPGKATVTSFADGETQIQVLDSVRGLDVYIFQSCNQPVNDRIIELLLMVSTMHRASAKRVTAVIPFMGYKHHRRVGAVSHDKTTRYLGSAGQDFAKMLEVLGAGLLTDGRKVAVVAPNPDTAKKAQIFRHGLIDAWQDAPRVSLAMFSRAPVVQGSKLHHESELLGDVNGKDVVIVDDIIDTANTLVRAAQVCKASGANNIFIFASHGLFTEDALRKIEECQEISKVVTTNTIPLPEWYSGKKVTQLSIAPLLAKRIEADHFRRHLYNEEVYVPDLEAST